MLHNSSTIFHYSCSACSSIPDYFFLHNYNGQWYGIVARPLEHTSNNNNEVESIKIVCQVNEFLFN